MFGGPLSPNMRLLLLLALLIPRAAMAQGSDSTIAIVGGTLIDGNGGSPQSNATILVRGGRIVSIEAGAAPPRGARVINAAGKYIVPGFVDANVHVSIWRTASR